MSGTVARVRAIRLVVLVVALAALWLPASAGAYVYWANYNLGNGTAIGRANLDGTGATEKFIINTPEPRGMAVDGQHVYWANPVAGTVNRANLDGSGGDRFFITGADIPDAVAVDGQHVYWANEHSESIGRANLDGTGVDQSFIMAGNSPYGVTVDGQHVYWAGLGGIGRANLDGTGVDQSFISLGKFAGAVAVDGQHVYWATDAPPQGAIGRANLDGSAVDGSFIAAGDIAPRGVAVDGQHIYWANAAGGTIGRASLDGSVSDPNFIEGPAPWGIAVDALPYPTATSLACMPAAVTLPASTSCTATVSDLAASSTPRGTVAFSSTGPGSFGSSATCSLVAVVGAQSACQLTFIPSLAGTDRISGAYLGGVMHAASSGTGSLSVLAPPVSFVPPNRPSNSFTLSTPKLNKRNGSAVLTATVPGPGTLLLIGRGIKRLARFVSRPGTVKLTIKGQPSTQRRLRRTGKARITVKVTYTPTGGDPTTESTKLTLRRGRR
jgi:virginiamycin B lyase